MPAFPVPSGLTFLLNADSGITSSGNRISQWNDQSTFGYNVTQTTASSQPYLMTNYYKGQTFVGFSGAQSIDNPSAWVASGTGARTVMTFQVPVANWEGEVYVNIGPNSNATTSMGYTWSTMWGWTGALDIRNYAYDFGTVGSTEPLVTVTPWSGASSATVFRYRNKTRVQPAGAGGGAAWNTSSGVMVGAFKNAGGYSFPLTKPIRDVAIWNRYLTETEMGQVVDHFLNNYPPADFAMSGTTATSATLTWTNGWNDAGKEIYRATVNDSASGTCIGVASSGATSWVDSPLTPATTYYYWCKDFVTNYTDRFTSSFSTVVSGTTSAGPTDGVPQYLVLPKYGE